MSAARNVIIRNLPDRSSQSLYRNCCPPTPAKSPSQVGYLRDSVSDIYGDGVSNANDTAKEGGRKSGSEREDAGEEFESYTLTIMGSRRMHFSFKTLAELTEELAKHLSPSEIRGGVLHRLTSFDKKRLTKEGYIKNKWQYFAVCAYPFEG